MAEQEGPPQQQQPPPPPLYVDETVIGFRFAPTEVELVRCYLANKIAGVDNDLAAVIPTVDLYGPASEPWRLCKEVACPYAASSTEFYCFATRKKRYDGKGRHCQRAAGTGTWSGTGHDGKVCDGKVVVGRRAFFSFKVRPPPGAAAADLVTTHWVMYEYRLESAEFQSTVVCKIRNQKKEDQMAKGTWVTPWWEECFSSSRSSSTKEETKDPIFPEKADEGFSRKRRVSPGREASGCKSKKQKRVVVRGRNAPVDNSEPEREGSFRDAIILAGSNGDSTGTPILDPSALAAAAAAEKETRVSTSLVTPVRVDCPLPPHQALVPPADALSSDTLSPDDTLFSSLDDFMDLGSLPHCSQMLGDITFSSIDEFMDPMGSQASTSGGDGFFFGGELGEF